MSEKIRIKKEYWPNGQVKSILYYNKNNQLHREDGPAEIRYWKDGSTKGERYYIKGRLHREKGPAAIWYREDGSIEKKCYYINNRLHREDGPAKIRYNSNNKPRGAYYLNGVNLRKQEWLKQIGLIKMERRAEEELEL